MESSQAQASIFITFYGKNYEKDILYHRVLLFINVVQLLSNLPIPPEASSRSGLKGSEFNKIIHSGLGSLTA